MFCFFVKALILYGSNVIFGQRLMPFYHNRLVCTSGSMFSTEGQRSTKRNGGLYGQLLCGTFGLSEICVFKAGNLDICLLIQKIVLSARSMMRGYFDFFRYSANQCLSCPGIYFSA